jgi:ribonuclease VapC
MKARPGHFVLDSYAILAYLGNEAGTARVREVLEQGQQNRATIYLSVVNYGEVVYITEREQGVSAAHHVIAAMDQWPVTLVEADRKLTLAAAHVKAHYAISYADAFAVALAQSRQATLLTGDSEFCKVEDLITIDWLAHNKPELPANSPAKSSSSANQPVNHAT